MKMNNIIVVYHYVRDNTSFKAMSTADFRTQVGHLARSYDIITFEELLKKRPSGNTCILTFDDGIKDCLTNALPILDDLGVRATFFISTAMLTERKILKANKIHVLLAELGVTGFAREFNGIADEIFHIRTEGISYGQDDDLTASLKFVLNNMDQTKCAQYLQKMFDRHFDEEAEFDKLYMSSEDLDILRAGGMEIGLHGHRHLHLGNLYFQDAYADLSTAAKIFADRFPGVMPTLSYPYGSYNPLTKRIARKLGVAAGVTINKGKNVGLDNPLELNRYDCIDAFPRGDRL